jgi:hypothetical protein
VIAGCGVRGQDERFALGEQGAPTLTSPVTLARYSSLVEDKMDDLDGYDADPELGDENDPEYKEEMFRTFRFMGTKPEQLVDLISRRHTPEWLKTAPPEEED